MLRVLLLVVLLSGAALAGSYTNADVEAERLRYRPARVNVLSPQFVQALMREPWVEPGVVPRMLPYQAWEDEYRSYFQRHVRDPRLELEPTVIVMHYTATRTFETAYRGWVRGVNMSAGRGTVRGHPSVHFMIDRDGTIFQLFPVNRRATGAYGVNHVSLQIEMVAADESDLLSNPAVVASGFRLARSLAATHGIPASKVYGHHEVSAGMVPEFLDYADPRWPRSYPPGSRRADPGAPFMTWLRHYLKGVQAAR